MATNKVSPDRRVWLNRTQLAERVGRSRQTIWRWQQQGMLPKPNGYDPHGNSLWLVETIDEFLKGGAKAA